MTDQIAGQENAEQSHFQV